MTNNIDSFFSQAQSRLYSAGNYIYDSYHDPVRYNEVLYVLSDAAVRTVLFDSIRVLAESGTHSNPLRISAITGSFLSFITRVSVSEYLRLNADDAFTQGHSTEISQAVAIGSGTIKYWMQGKNVWAGIVDHLLYQNFHTTLSPVMIETTNGAFSLTQNFVKNLKEHSSQAAPEIISSEIAQDIQEPIVTPVAVTNIGTYVHTKDTLMQAMGYGGLTALLVAYPYNAANTYLYNNYAIKTDVATSEQNINQSISAFEAAHNCPEILPCPECPTTVTQETPSSDHAKVELSGGNAFQEYNGPDTNS